MHFLQIMPIIETAAILQRMGRMASKFQVSIQFTLTHKIGTHNINALIYEKHLPIFLKETQRF